jgi:hypothetical protein
MTVWLKIQGEPRAHAFPDADDAYVAACGYEIPDECEHCGGSLECAERPHAEKCSACVAQHKSVAPKDDAT